MAIQNKLPGPSKTSVRRQIPALDDLRFRTLLPGGEWERLPAAIRQRFSKRLAGGETVVYVGEIDQASSSRLGRLIVQIARAIGGPLPTGTETGVPIIVTVTEDAMTGGQVWTRVCVRPQRVSASDPFIKAL